MSGMIFCKHCKRRIHPDDYSGSGFRHEEDWSISCSGTLAEPELTEQRKALLDDPANTLFGIPMTAVKRLINEKRAEDGDDWWVLERPRAELTEQRGVTSAKEFWKTFPHCVGYPSCDGGDLVGYAHSECCPLFGKEEVSTFEFAEAYASSRLAGKDAAMVHFSEQADEWSDKYHDAASEVERLTKERDALRDKIISARKEILQDGTWGSIFKALFNDPLIEAEAENRELKQEVARLTGERDALRQRMFGNAHTKYCSHTTSCTIWGDDGQGGTPEKFQQPLPCNCGALENFEHGVAKTYKAQLSQAQQALGSIAEMNCGCSTLAKQILAGPSDTPPQKIQAHSKSEYKRLVVQTEGKNIVVEPPE